MSGMRDSFNLKAANDNGSERGDHREVLGRRLLHAVEGGDLEAVRQWVTAGACVDARYEATWDTPLIIAATEGYEDVVGYLIRRNADVNARNQVDSTALLEAIKGDNGACARKLLAAKAEVNIVDSMKQSPLYLAARVGDTGLVRDLVKAGAVVDAPMRDGKTALMMAFMLSHDHTFKALLELGACPDARMDGQMTLLMTVARDGDGPRVAQLLSVGARTLLKNEDGMTAAALAAAAGHARIAGMIEEAERRQYRDAVNRGTEREIRVMKPVFRKGIP